MTPTIFLYVMIFTALIAGAAAAMEWGVQGRTPLRHFWTVAIVLALLAPPIAMATSSARPTAAPTSPDIELLTVNIATGNTREQTHVRWRNDHETLASSVMHRARLIGERVIPTASPRALITMLVGWIIASLMLVAWVAAGVLHWRRERRAWEPATVDGVAVDVSPSTGPAVLGVLSQRIVLPSWATSMAPEYRTLMLAHECEHIRARDPQRLALALVALILMPWNAALWWCVARLRRAIELDCDARVLRMHPATKAYGYLLLEVAARGRNTGALAMPFIGLLRLPSELETRLRAMTRPRSIARRTLIGAGVLTLGALGAAFATPVPRVANGKMVQVHVDTVPQRRQDSVAMLRRQLDSVTTELRQLEARRRELPPDVIVVDSVRAGEVRARRFSVTVDTARLHGAHGAEFSIRIDNREKGKDVAGAPMMIHGPLQALDADDVRQSAARTDSAMAAMYPDLVAHPDSQAAVWFVRDSRGRVVKTARSTIGPDGRLDPGLVSKQFPDLKTDDIATVEIRKRSGTRGAGAVIWITLKQ